MSIDWANEAFWSGGANSLTENLEWEDADDFTGSMKLGTSLPKLCSEMNGLLREESTSEPWRLL